MDREDVVISLGLLERCLVLLQRPDDDRADIGLKLLRPIMAAFSNQAGEPEVKY